MTLAANFIAISVIFILQKDIDKLYPKKKILYNIRILFSCLACVNDYYNTQFDFLQLSTKRRKLMANFKIKIMEDLYVLND